MIWNIASIIAMIAFSVSVIAFVASLLVGKKNIKTIFQVISTICIVVSIVALSFTIFQKDGTVKEYGFQAVRSNMLKSNDNENKYITLKSNNGERKYDIWQNMVIDNTLWDVVIDEGTAHAPFENIARYLVKNETVFLFNEHGVHSSYTMTITLTPWTIEDIEKMDGIEITDYIK